MRAYVIIIIFTISYCDRKSSDKKVGPRVTLGQGVLLLYRADKGAILSRTDSREGLIFLEQLNDAHYKEKDSHNHAENGANLGNQEEVKKLLPCIPCSVI
jgi:hypothetical protein